MTRARTITAEVIQFAPILTLASTFVVSGEVDLERAATLFVVAAGEAVMITAALLAVRARFNPVLLGTNLWLILGAAGYGLPIEPLADVLGRFQAAGLFACALAVGGLLTAVSPTGYIGVELPERRTVLAGSVILLALTAAALAWALIFADNVRLGGGLPFILLNVTRRVLGRQLVRRSDARASGSDDSR